MFRSLAARPARMCMRLRPVRMARPNSISTDGQRIDEIIDQVSPQQYSRISNEYLDHLGDELETLAEDYPQIDCELSQGVMTLTVPPAGTYVINRQPPNKQMWLSSPVSGPKRYDLVQGKWVTLRDNTKLTELLEKEIGEVLGKAVSFGLEQ